MRSLIAAVARRPEVRYLVFGGINTAFSYGLFWIALVALHACAVPGDYAIAITFSWVVSNLTSFVLQRRFVFHGSGHPMRELVKFTSVSFGSFLANIALSTLSVALGFTSQTEKLVSQLIVTAILVVATYILHRVFSFRPRPMVEPAGTTAIARPEFDSDDPPAR